MEFSQTLARIIAIVMAGLSGAALGAMILTGAWPESVAIGLFLAIVVGVLVFRDPSRMKRTFTHRFLAGSGPEHLYRGETARIVITMQPVLQRMGEFRETIGPENARMLRKASFRPKYRINMAARGDALQVDALPNSEQYLQRDGGMPATFQVRGVRAGTTDLLFAPVFSVLVDGQERKFALPTLKYPIEVREPDALTGGLMSGDNRNLVIAFLSTAAFVCIMLAGMATGAL